MSAPSGDWRLWAASSAVFAAATALLSKVGVDGVNPTFATFIRTLVIAPVVFALLLATRQWQPPGGVSARTYLFLGLSGLATGASWLCYFQALKLGPAARVAPVDKLSVVLVALGGVVLLGERLTLAAWGGVAFITLGAVMLALG